MAQVRHIVVVGDPAEESLQPLQDEAGVRVVVVENLQQVKQEAQKAPIDGLVLSEKAAREGLRDLPHVVDVSKTLIISGPPSVPAALDSMKWLLRKGDGREANHGLQAFRDLTLEDYVELKFGEVCSRHEGRFRQEVARDPHPGGGTAIDPTCSS